MWLTIPVDSKGKYSQAISETLVSEVDLESEHWNAQRSRAIAIFPYLEDRVKGWYQSAVMPHLSQINFLFLTNLCSMLSIETKLSWSTDYPSKPGKTDRLVQLCLACGATNYLSGPAARAYIEPRIFERGGR